MRTFVAILAVFAASAATSGCMTAAVGAALSFPILVFALGHLERWADWAVRLSF